MITKFVAGSVALTCLVGTSCSALAQGHTHGLGGPTFDSEVTRLKTLKSGTDVQEVQGNGVTVKGAIAIEAGRDTNPEQIFTGQQKTNFVGTDGALLLDFGTQASGLTILGRGSVADYIDTDRRFRWDAGVLVDFHADNVLGSRLNVGGLALADTYGYSKQETLAVNYELLRETKRYDAYLRGRVFDLVYSEQGREVAAVTSPFALTSEFSYRRAEQQAGVLLMKEHVISPYVTGSIADVEYTKQSNPALLNRSAFDSHIAAGVRVKLGADVFADVGGRYNNRRTDDARVGTHESSGFDGRIVWTPRAGVVVSLDYDRVITEPGSVNAVLADKDIYTLSIDYKPAEKWNFTTYLSTERSIQIGDIPVYKRNAAVADVTYAILPNTQVFGNLIAERTTDENSSDVANRLRLGVGVKQRF
jgi:hypothetical protein